MPLLIIQLAILIAVIFIIGSLIGRYARRSAGNRTEDRKSIAASALAEPAPKSRAVDESSETAPKQSTAQKETEAPARVIEPKTRPVETERKPLAAEKPAKAAIAAVSATSEPLVETHISAGANDNVGRPQAREAARRGKADDLTRITGIGEALQDQLFAVGIFHFDQIAVWTAEESAWIGQKLSFPGRVEREEWVKQAASLSKAAAKPATKSASKPAAKATAKTAEKPAVTAPVKAAAKSVAKPATKSAEKPAKAKAEATKPAAVKAPSVKKPAASKPAAAQPAKKRAKPASDKA